MSVYNTLCIACNWVACIMFTLALVQGWHQDLLVWPAGLALQHLAVQTEVQTWMTS